jgi:transcriptional regulator with XRE-family HTH domain
MLDPDQEKEKRKSLAEALRELRKAAGLSGERLAVRCAMSQAKISRIETGKVLPSVVDVERILRALGIGSAEAEPVLALARLAAVGYVSRRTSARLGFWQRQNDLKALERDSRVVRHFLPAIPTGLLQTPGYAEVVLSPTVASEPVGDITKIIEGRIARQRAVGGSSQRFLFLLTEQAVTWRIAGPRVMAGQVERLIELSRFENLDVAVLPRTAVVPEAPLNVFVVYDERLVTAELFAGSVALRDPRDIAYHVELFEFFWAHALKNEEAASFLRVIADEFLRESE